MRTLLVNTTAAIDRRLHELGWAREEFMEVIDAMVSGRFGCTENDPLSAPGWMAWKDGTRRLREIALPKGLIRNNHNQIPWTYDPERGLRIAVSNTNENTGLPGDGPQNNTRKGTATAAAVSDNQWSFIDKLEDDKKIVPFSRATKQPGSVKSWFLCVYMDDTEVRAELSCPIAIEDGFFTGFVERIILLSGDPGEFEKRRSSPSDEDDFEIQVSRK